MNDNEQMAVIGRMVTERKQLGGTLSALQDEADRLGRILERLAREVSKFRSPYHDGDLKLEGEFLEVLDAGRISRLIANIRETKVCAQELDERLKQAGVY